MKSPAKKFLQDTLTQLSALEGRPIKIQKLVRREIEQHITIRLQALQDEIAQEILDMEVV